MRSPHLAIQVPRVRGVAGYRVVVGIRMALVEVWKISIAPGQLSVLIGITVFLPWLTIPKKARLLQGFESLALLRRHALFFTGKHLVKGCCAGKRAAQNEVRKVLLILQRISLRQNAAIRVSEQINLAEIQRLADSLNVVRHIFDGVLARILQLF